MADPRSSELLFYATPGGGMRIAALLLAFIYGVGICPELEDMGDLWLAALAAFAGAFMLLTLGGSAWVFDVSRREQARERVKDLGGYAAGALFCVFFSFAGADGPAPPGTAMGFLGAWLCWCDWPWNFVDFLYSAMSRSPGARDYAMAKAATPPAPRIPKVPGPLPPGAEALIDSGSFKIDRDRMLQKLSQYQLENAEDFLLPWLRLAEASGASRIDLDRMGRVIELRFDGRPLAPAWTADPYASLFEEEDFEAARHRQLAYGLLALLRLGPESVEVCSGEGAGRARLRVLPKGEKAPPSPEPSGPGTFIRVRLDFLTGWLVAIRAILRARDEFGLAKAVLFIHGKEVTPEWTLYGEKGIAFENGTTRGVVIPPTKGQNGNSICFQFMGVFAGREFEYTGGPEHIAWIRDDSLSLNISQSGLVENEAYKTALRTARQEASRLVPKGVYSRDPGDYAYTKAGLFSALGGSVAAWAGLMWSLDRRPELAFAALAAYAAVTAAMGGLLVKWARGRLAGKPNPFRAPAP